MAREVYRRCSCRDEQGKQYGQHCPKLKSNPRHGTWCWRLSAGTAIDAATGREKRRRVSGSGFPTREAAQAACDRVKAQLRRGTYDFTRRTVAEFAEQWYQRGEASEWAPKTAREYRRQLDRDILPALGDLRLSQLRRAHVADLLDSMVADGRGPVTIRRTHACLSSMLGDAETRELIEYNPAAKVRLPKTVKADVQVWAESEVEAFLAKDAQLDDRLHELWIVALGTGLRRGELLGLRWTDVDLAGRRLTVRVQLLDLPGTPETPVKTASGQGREVPLVEPVVDALVAWKGRVAAEAKRLEAVGLEHAHSDRVFVDELGGDLRPAGVSDRFARAVKNAGAPALTFHGLRHTFASVALGSGQEMAVVSKLMGHSTVAITVDLYSKLATDRRREAMGGIGDVLQAACSGGHTIGHTPASKTTKAASVGKAETASAA
jgi:integrase